MKACARLVSLYMLNFLEHFSTLFLGFSVYILLEMYPRGSSVIKPMQYIMFDITAHAYVHEMKKMDLVAKRI